MIRVAGTRSQTEALLPEVATVLSTVGLRLSVDKTLITHIDEGLDFLGWRIQRPEAGNQPALRLQLPGQEGPAVDQGQVQDDLPDERQPAAGGPTAPTQLGATGLDRLLPCRGVCPRVWIPAHDRLASGIRVAAAQTSELGLEEPASPLLRQHMVAAGRRGRVVQPRFGSHHALPAKGVDDPFALANGKLRTMLARRGLWRAGCGANSNVRFGRAA